MTLDEKFLAVIKAQPNNNQEKDVYADYLESIGELDKAEFVRLDSLISRINKLRKILPKDWMDFVSGVVSVRCPTCSILASLTASTGESIPRCVGSCEQHGRFNLILYQIKYTELLMG